MQSITQNSKFTCKICFEEYYCISSIHNYNAYKYYGCCKDCLIESIKLHGSQPIDTPIGYSELMQISKDLDEFAELSDIIMKKTVDTDPILKDIMIKSAGEKPYFRKDSLVHILSEIMFDKIHPDILNDLVVTPYENIKLSEQIRDNREIVITSIKTAIISSFRDCYIFNDLLNWIKDIRSVYNYMIKLIGFNCSDLVRVVLDELSGEYVSRQYMENLAEIDTFADIVYKIEDVLKSNRREDVQSLESLFHAFTFEYDDFFNESPIRYAKEYVEQIKTDRTNIGICECGHGVIIKSSHQCSSCKQNSCDKCLKIFISNSNDKSQHECSKEDLETVAYYHSHCKNCPKCGTWIEKSAGCNDMFCTKCHTLFDFVSGNQKYGNLHNPERMEYLERIGQQDESFNYTLSEICDHVYMIDKINRDSDNIKIISNFTKLIKKIIGISDNKLNNEYAKLFRLKDTDSYEDLKDIYRYAGLKGFHQFELLQETPLESTLVKQYSFFMMNTDENYHKILYGMNYIWNYEKERRMALEILAPKICALSQMLIQNDYDLIRIERFILESCREVDDKVGGKHIRNLAITMV